jgi:hypothetical protein
VNAIAVVVWKSDAKLSVTISLFGPLGRGWSPHPRVND